jgi:hypothetical protein
LEKEYWAENQPYWDSIMFNLTKKIIEQWGEYWIPCLRLVDWDIDYVIVHPNEINGDYGSCSYSFQMKTASIKLANPSVLNNYNDSHSVEITFVHELIHLHFAPFYKFSPDPEHHNQEQAINLIAGALVRARYTRKD